MFKIFSRIINRAKLAYIQKFQYDNRILLEDTVPAGSKVLSKVSITSLGDFLCQEITGSFETLFDDAGAIKDDGVNHLRFRFIDGTTNRPLFEDSIPGNLLLTPGRRKSSKSTTLLTDPPANRLYKPRYCEYLFGENSEIIVEAINDSNTALDYSIEFHGVRRFKKEPAKKKKVFQTLR